MVTWPIKCLPCPQASVLPSPVILISKYATFTTHLRSVVHRISPGVGDIRQRNVNSMYSQMGWVRILIWQCTKATLTAVVLFGEQSSEQDIVSPVFIDIFCDLN